MVLTDRDSAAGAPVPVAVNVTLCAAPSHGTGIRPTPVTGKPAAAGNGWPSTEKLTAWVFCVTQAAETSTVVPLHVTSSSTSNRLIDGAVGGGGLFEVLTWRARLTWPPCPDATSGTRCSRPSHGTGTLPTPLTG